MGEDLPRVARLDATSLIEARNARTDLGLRLLRELLGGEVGAACVRMAGGQVTVLTSWPGELGARAPRVAEIVARLRARGYPAPSCLAIIDCGPTTAVLQEHIVGVPISSPTLSLVDALLGLNTQQRGVLPQAGGSVADLYLDRDGPGYCLHGSPRQFDRSTRALLDVIHEVGRTLPQE